MATSRCLQNMMNLTSAKVCEDTSGPEECIEPPDAVTFGFKNRFPTYKSSQLNEVTHLVIQNTTIWPRWTRELILDFDPDDQHALIKG